MIYKNLVFIMILSCFLCCRDKTDQGDPKRDFALCALVAVDSELNSVPITSDSVTFTPAQYLALCQHIYQ